MWYVIVVNQIQPPALRSLPLSQNGRRGLGIAVVVGIVLLQVAVQYVASHDRVRALSQVLFMSFEMPLLMGVLSFGYGWTTRRRMGPFATLFLGVLVAGCLGAIFGALLWLVAQKFPAIRFHADTSLQLTRAVAFGITFGQLHFGLWALAFVFPFAVDDAKLRALESEKLRLEADQLRSLAELAQLRANLEPHFLLNTLNAVAGLVVEDPREARRLLVCLGDLLRDALHDETELQPLDKQMDWLRRYADVLEARYPKALTFSWHIASEVKDALVPRLLLQPLVENAVKHGALKRDGGCGNVVVRANISRGVRPDLDRLVCSIEDNGPGIHEQERDTAFGLRAVRRRLQLKYGANGVLHLESTTAGTRAIVELPSPSLR
jgi:signal transduction histidine kinase